MKEVIELDDNLAGNHIENVCAKALELANKEGAPVHFKFNDVDVTIQPGETVGAAYERWDADTTAKREAWLASPEYKEREEKRAREAAEARAAHMIEGAKTEEELRDVRVPWPLTKEQLLEYVESLVNRSHDYGTCVYAMSMAAEAAFNYVSGQLGVTGFQASCADLDFIRRTRSVKGPFMLIKAEDALYPQSDPREKLDEALQSWQPWLKEEAAKKIAESTLHVHPDVKSHWEKLADEGVAR